MAKFAIASALLLLAAVYCPVTHAGPPPPCYTSVVEDVGTSMFPDGLGHDFGKIPQGTQARHAFRIVNTSRVPIRILSVRRGG